ncbi:hypothetical protein ACFLYA_01265 [Candidatus Dependentiae bacterium]
MMKKYVLASFLLVLSLCNITKGMIITEEESKKEKTTYETCNNCKAYKKYITNRGCNTPEEEQKLFEPELFDPMNQKEYYFLPAEPQLLKGKCKKCDSHQCCNTKHKRNIFSRRKMVAQCLKCGACICNSCKVKDNKIIEKDSFFQKLAKKVSPVITVLNSSGQDLLVQICPGAENGWKNVQKGENVFFKTRKSKKFKPFSFSRSDDDEGIEGLVNKNLPAKGKIIIRWRIPGQNNNNCWETKELDNPKLIVLKRYETYAVDPQVGQTAKNEQARKKLDN